MAGQPTPGRNAADACGQAGRDPSAVADLTPGPLAAAYLGARYRINAPGTAPPVVLRIGHACPQLADLAQGCELPDWGVFLTACNPRSRRLRPAANRRRMRALHRALAQLGYAAMSGQAQDPTGCWPDEASLWIPGLPLDQGHALARRFGQNAFVWCDAQHQVHLIWTQPSHVVLPSRGPIPSRPIPFRGDPPCTAC